MKTFDITEIQSAPAGEGGIRVSYAGEPDGLLIAGGLQDASVVYSANLPFNISDTWKWGYPSPPTPLGLLTGYIHTNAIQMNGVTSPPV